MGTRKKLLKWNRVYLDNRCLKRVKDWPYSSFHRWVARGIYPVTWASNDPNVIDWDLE